MADPDPMTCDPGSPVYDPDPGTVIPDPIYLVTTLSWILLDINTKLKLAKINPVIQTVVSTIEG